jgi:broad specificity phosphatase PhoE
MTTFFLIRHALCDGLGQTLWGRTPNIRLNHEGKTQAERLAETCEGVGFDAVYSSPLERALETADALASRLKLDVRKSAALNEIDYGEWSGKTFEQLHSDQRWRHFNNRRSTTNIPGGESFLEVQNRVVKEIDRLSGEHSKGRVALVSHADPIRAAIAYFATTAIDLIERFEISPCSVSVIVAGDENVKLLTINHRLNGFSER